MNELQIASAIQNYVTSGEGVTYSSIDIEQIRDEVDTLRMRYVEDLDKNRGLIPEAYYQVLSGNSVKTTPILSGKFKGWTEITLPPIYTNLKGKPQIQYIGPVGEQIPNKVAVGNHGIYVPSNKYFGDYPLVVCDGQKYRFKEGYKTITVKALFEDPSDLEAYSSYDSGETNYPAPRGTIDLIIGKTSESYIRTQSMKTIQPNTQVDIGSMRSR